MERQLGNLRTQLEQETLNRVDVENRLQSLKEELAFKDQMHEQVYTTVMETVVLILFHELKSL